MNDETQTPSRGIAVPADCGVVAGRGPLRDWRKALLLRALVPVRKLLPPRYESAFGILMYHRVTPRVPGVAEPTWNVTPARFGAQLAGLLRRGYVAWPLSRVLECSAAGEPIPRRTFVITFDDGYANNLTEALPILRALRVPATIFLATAYLDSSEPFPSDDWAAAGSVNVPIGAWRPLSLAETDELRAEPLIELGAHTHTHDDFRGRPADLEADLRTCVGVLRERWGVERPAFAFPYGTKRLGFAGGELTEAARRSGVRCALTTEGELVHAGSDPFDWGRFTAHEHDSARTLAVRMDGWWCWLRRHLASGRRQPPVDSARLVPHEAPR